MENIVGDLKLNKYEDYINIFDALSHPVRIKIIGILAEGRQYVSELARLVNISRPLLYMHLKKLETARLVTSAMEMFNEVTDRSDDADIIVLAAAVGRF